MAKHSVARIKVWLAHQPWPAGMSLVLAAGLALLAASLAVAQSQLPGNPLTSDSANDLRPAWSADGRQIAFFSSRTGNYDIWVMNADGANQHQLTDDLADDRRPAWSPDGTHLVFDSDRGGTRDIWVMDADGGNPRQLTNGPALDSFPSWSPDGSQIAFYSLEDGTLDIWIVAVEDFLQGGAAGQPRQLTNELAVEQQNQCTYACHVPAWSPDSRQIAYLSDQTQIWVIEADGKSPHPLTDGEGREHFPWWAADGKIFYLNEHRSDQQEPVNDVWVMDADGSNKTLLFPNIPHGGPFYWSPSENGLIAFHSPRAGNFDIYTITLGQEASTPQPFVATPMADTEETAAPVLEPTATAAVAATAAPVSESTGLPGPALVGAVAVVVVGGVLAVFYLARRSRAS